MIRFLLNVYAFVIIADVVLSYMPNYRNEPWRKGIAKAADYTIGPVRKVLPQDLPFDLAPLIVLIIIQIIPGLW